MMARTKFGMPRCLCHGHNACDVGSRRCAPVEVRQRCTGFLLSDSPEPPHAVNVPASVSAWVRAAGSTAYRGMRELSLPLSHSDSVFLSVLTHALQKSIQGLPTMAAKHVHQVALHILVREGRVILVLSCDEHGGTSPEPSAGTWHCLQHLIYLRNCPSTESTSAAPGLFSNPRTRARSPA